MRAGSQRAHYERDTHRLIVAGHREWGVNMNPTVTIGATLIALGALSVIAHWFLPRLARPDLYFAVTVSPAFRDSREGHSILRRYRLGLLAVSIPALTLLVTLTVTHRLAWTPVALLVLNGACFGVYYRTRRLVLAYAVAPTSIREARIDAPARRIPGGWIGASGPFAVLAASAAYLGAHWQQIPARLPLHWNLNGQPDVWAASSPGTVFLPIFIAAVTLTALTLLLYGTAHWVRPIYADGPKGRQESRFRTIISLMLLVIEYWIASRFSMLALRPLLPAALQHPSAAAVFIPGLIAIALTAVLMWLGQGGSRRSSAPLRVDSAQPVGDRTEDRFWKLGVFYFNRDDPSVMVEKRFGLGYTVNFARPAAWLIVLLPLLVAIGVSATIAARHRLR